MRKVFRLQDLDCANCARKMEDGIRKLDGVLDVSVNFIAQRMTLEAEDADFEKVLQAAIKTIRRIEPDCRVIL